MMTTDNPQTYLTLSGNIIEFLDIQDDELYPDLVFPVYKKTKNELVERVLTYVHDNKLYCRDGYVKLDKKLKKIIN